MKASLVILTVILATAGAARADDFTLSNDVSGSNCHFASGFNNSIYVIERFSNGSTGSRFKVELSPGSTLLDFQSPHAPIGNILTDLSVAYGYCAGGTIVIGTITANLNPGVMWIKPADGFLNIIYDDCSNEYPGFSSPAYVDMPGSPCNNPLATEPTTWGAVKSLYR